jgi:hypothetical protein
MKAMVELGWPPGQTVGLGILVLACTAVYVIPRTSILGAILLTGWRPALRAGLQEVCAQPHRALVGWSQDHVSGHPGREAAPMDEAPSGDGAVMAIIVSSGLKNRTSTPTTTVTVTAFS